MTQGQIDGKNLKFRVLCKRCNSYLHTLVIPLQGDMEPRLRIECDKCGNAADDFEEAFA